MFLHFQPQFGAFIIKFLSQYKNVHIRFTKGYSWLKLNQFSYAQIVEATIRK
jgi:hypothetical protein